MKITAVRAVQPNAPEAPADWRTVVGQLLVAIDTDSGLRGIGIAGGGQCSIHLITRLFRDALLGRDPLDVAGAWQILYKMTLPFGRKGIALMAISGVDLALWDLRGKAEGVPVCRLLAEDPLPSVPAYATLGITPGVTPGQAAEAGFAAVKLHLPAAGTESECETVVGAVRDARRQIGPTVRLMTDAFMRWNVPTTLRLAPEFAQEQVEWIEEPLPADDLAGYAELMRESPIPIAGGEHEYTAAGFQELADRRLHAILQPDVTWCGGLSELIKVYRLAEQAGLRVCQHRGAETWGLHAIAALERADPLAEGGRPWLNWLLDQPQIEAGSVRVPETPGFGVRVDESLLP